MTATIGNAISLTLTRLVRIPAFGASLPAELTIPDGACGIVVLAHLGDGGHLSGPERRTAAELRGHGFGTLTLNLLTAEEEMAGGDRRELSFDVPFLSRRLADVVEWAEAQESMAGLPVTVLTPHSRDIGARAEA